MIIIQMNTCKVESKNPFYDIMDVTQTPYLRGFKMLRTGPKQISLYSILYDKIPDNHILKSINSAVDFILLIIFWETPIVNITAEQQRT